MKVTLCSFLISVSFWLAGCPAGTTPTPTATIGPSDRSPTPTATAGSTLIDYRGVYALQGANAIPGEGNPVFNSPADGIVLRLSWNFLEPTVGHREFSRLTAFLATCQAHSKKAVLYLGALSDYPSDLSPDTVTVPGPHPYQLAYPWGSKFLTAFKAFIATLGQFDGQLAICVMGGMGEHGVSILSNDPAVIAKLDAVGGLDAWKTSCQSIADSYMSAFQKSRCMFSAKNPYGEGNPGGAHALDTIVRSLCAQYPHRIGVSNPDLFADTNGSGVPGRLIHDLGPTNPTGYQLRDNATHPFGPGLCAKGEATPAPTPCLAAAFAAGIKQGARELEPYDVDVNNPAFADLIRTTSSQLKTLDQ